MKPEPVFPVNGLRVPQGTQSAKQIATERSYTLRGLKVKAKKK